MCFCVVLWSKKKNCLHYWLQKHTTLAGVSSFIIHLIEVVHKWKIDIMGPAQIRWEKQVSLRSQTLKRRTTQSSLTGVYLLSLITQHCDRSIRTLWQIGRSKRFWTVKRTLSGMVNEICTVGLEVVECMCIHVCVRNHFGSMGIW